MATKKSAAAAKKPASKKAAPARAAKSTTKVTTVKAVAEPKRVSRTMNIAARVRAQRLALSRSPIVAASIAEFIGAFLLAAIILAGQNQPLPVFFAYIGIVLAIAGVSGAHVNPVITIGAWATRRVSSARATAYVVAQLLGGVLALVLISSFVAQAPAQSEEAAMFGQSAAKVFSLAEIPAGKEWLILSTEMLGAAIFAFAVAAAFTMRSRSGAAFGIASGFFIATFFGGYLASIVGGSAAVINPSAAAALQALSFEWWPLAVYVLAPIVGGIIGFGLHTIVSSQTKELAV